MPSVKRGFAGCQGNFNGPQTPANSISFPIMQELQTVEAQTLKGLPMPAQGRAERDTVGSKPAILPGEVGPDIQNVQI